MMLLNEYEEPGCVVKPGNEKTGSNKLPVMILDKYCLVQRQELDNYTKINFSFLEGNLE